MIQYIWHCIHHHVTYSVLIDVELGDVLPKSGVRCKPNKCKHFLFLAAPSSEMVDMKIKIEFGGGLELLFSNTRSHLITISSTNKKGQPVDIEFLIHWLNDNLLKERSELFIEHGTL
jgi:hypothetical protein